MFRASQSEQGRELTFEVRGEGGTVLGLFE